MRSPKWQCKSCLNHCNPGVIYCVCGRLMTADSAENRKYISSTLESFSIPSFYIRKDRPRGHRYGKAPGCKEYHAANQLAKKCRKREYVSIHDRYIRDKAFRKAMIDIGRTEQMIVEMDKLANEDHSYKASKEEIEFYRGNWWIHSNVARVDSIPTRYEPEFKSCVVNNAAPEASRGQKRSKKRWHKPLHPRLRGIGIQAGGSLITSTHLKNGMTTDDTGKPVFWWFSTYLREESQRAEEFGIFIVKSVTADGSLLSPTGCVQGMNPAPHIHEHLRYTIMATALRTPSRITTSRLSTLR